MENNCLSNSKKFRLLLDYLGYKPKWVGNVIGVGIRGTVKRLSILLILTILALAGCTIGYRGPIDYPPSITSNNPAEITVKRIWSLNIGAQPFTFLINDRDVYKLNNGESISFKIDPGEYKFTVNSTGGWKMWNSHDLYLKVLSGKSYRIILEADFNLGSSIKNATDNY